MGRHYLGWRENVSLSVIILFASYGEMLSCWVTDTSCDVDFVRRIKAESFPAKRESYVHM